MTAHQKPVSCPGKPHPQSGGLVGICYGCALRGADGPEIEPAAYRGEGGAMKCPNETPAPMRLKA